MSVVIIGLSFMFFLMFLNRFPRRMKQEQRKSGIAFEIIGSNFMHT